MVTFPCLLLNTYTAGSRTELNKRRKNTSKEGDTLLFYAIWQKKGERQCLWN